MNKMVINHLEKLFVTSDASTIVNELEVQHPAARILVLAAKAQEQEIGDGTNTVVSIAGQLLALAESLLRDGLHPSEIADGYNKAGERALQLMEESVIEGTEKLDNTDVDAVAKRIKGTISSKQYGYEETIARLVARACIDVCPKNPMNFNVDNVRVAKIVGSSILDSDYVRGVVLQRGTEGSVKSMKDAKVAVYGLGVDTSGTETKGTVLIHSAEELQNYSKSEEEALEKRIKAIAATGCNVVVSGSSVGEMAMHFLEREKIMVIKLTSKFELRRLCRAVGATSLLKLDPPTPDELGFASSMRMKEIGSNKVIIVEQTENVNSVGTILLRGATDQMMNDVERAVDDGTEPEPVTIQGIPAVPCRPVVVCVNTCLQFLNIRYSRLCRRGTLVPARIPGRQTWEPVTVEVTCAYCCVQQCPSVVLVSASEGLSSRALSMPVDLSPRTAVSLLSFPSLNILVSFSVFPLSRGRVLSLL